MYTGNPRTRISDALNRIRGLPKPWWVALTVVSLLLIVVLDYVTKSVYTFSLFYLFPIGISIFKVGPAFGYPVAAICTLLWTLDAVNSGRPFNSILLVLWTVGMRLLNYLLFAFVFSKLRSLILSSRSQIRSLEAANAAKHLLLNELTHRVKNSLASVAGLIGLEEGTSEDPALRLALERLQDRVKSVAELYTILSHSSNVIAVNLAEYLSSIAASLREGFGASTKGILIELSLEDLRMDSKHAVSVGIIVNELVTDAFKYAFVGRSRGTIRLCLRRESSIAVLEIADDGVGLPKDFDPLAGSGFGLKLVTSLSRDLGASLEIGSGPGARFILRIPIQEVVEEGVIQ